MERVKEWFLDVLFPEGNACHLCGRGMTEAGILCSPCLDQLHALRLKPAACVHSRRHPPIRLCVSAFPHTDEARGLVHLLKYSSDCAAASLLGECMAHALAVSAVGGEHYNMVIPVPLHPERLEARGYNQALLLSREICAHLSLALEEEVLVRIRPTATQTVRGREARMEAMQGAFRVSKPRLVQSKSILLVDDVITTGATAMSCARALMNAGAGSVTMLTACRA